jgi:outer membrane immunogenic protein
MMKSSINRVAFAALATLTISGADGAFAQSADTRRTEDIEKENAALKARVHRLEAEKENANLRARLGQLQGQPAPRQVADRTPAPEPATQRELINYAGGRDLKAPALPMAPYYSWTGFYIGGNIGYSVGSDRASGVLSVPNFKETSGPDTAIVPFGAIGGGQLGYNWQGGSNWLVGFEADFQGSGQKGTSCVVGCINAPSAALLQTFTARHTLDYFGTVRGRFGFVNNDALFYVTGGGVYGRVNQTLEARQSLAGVGTFSAGSTIENKFGFVVGAGLEASLGGNWTGKIEYLYMDLGSTGTGLAGTVPGVPVTPFTFTASSTIRDNIVRAGLNYRFGEPGAPLNALAADYPMPAPATSHVYSWTGFYVGANVGYGFGNDRDLMSEPIGTTPVTSEPGSSITPKGVIGGVQLGYNWQGSPNWLVGFEADLQGSAQTDTACGPIICLSQTPVGGGAASSAQFNTLQQQIDYFGTLRGRLGAVKDSVVYYVTGGAAFGHVRQSVNATATGVGLFVSGASSAEMIGWTVGGGIEAALWGNWTAKAEYLYMNLGSIRSSVDVSSPGAPGTLATNSTVRDHVVRIGANYHFDTGSGAITARY